MRCPKCQYISFDSGERCRNCGYEFALAADAAPVDVKIGREEPGPGRIRDAGLSAFDTPISIEETPAETVEEREAPKATAPAKRPLTMSDLPLFTDRVADDQAPLVTPPAVPRPPLSVRRATPVARPGRARSAVDDELPLEPDAARRGDLAQLEAEAAAPAVGRTASLARRFSAGLVDVSILAAIEATVVYLTLRLCELTTEQWRLLPPVPLVAFLLLLCGGYFILFTAAGGQTIGKMATAIRVVNDVDGEGGSRVSFSTAFLRTVASLGSVLALGAGFVPVLLRPDHRAFHDRVARTRVVPA